MKIDFTFVAVLVLIAAIFICDAIFNANKYEYYNAISDKIDRMQYVIDSQYSRIGSIENSVKSIEIKLNRNHGIGNAGAVDE